MLLIKIHESYRKVVALCDSELVGRTFKEGKIQLDVRKNFYQGEHVNSDKAVHLLQSLARDDATFNIVGKMAVRTAVEAGLITEKAVCVVQDIPFAFVLI